MKAKNGKRPKARTRRTLARAKPRPATPQVASRESAPVNPGMESGTVTVNRVTCDGNTPGGFRVVPVPVQPGEEV